MHTVRVWDLPTRLFHWALVVCVIGQIITANVGGNWMNWHLRLGYTVLTLLLFRLVWGFVGGHWSRFSSFLYAPSTVLNYLRGQARPEHRVGHNPLGAFSVFALLAILLLQVGSGLFSDDEIAFTGPLVSLVSGEAVSLADIRAVDTRFPLRGRFEIRETGGGAVREGATQPRPSPCGGSLIASQ